MRKLVHMDIDSIEHVCSAIIGQAVKDYTVDPRSRAGCDARAFFQSEWFYMISNGIDGAGIIEKIDMKLKKFQELCRQNKPEVWRDTGEANKCIFGCPFCGGKVKIIWGRDSLKGFTVKTYVHQCEICGIRQSMEFNGDSLMDYSSEKQCADCIWFKPSKGRHFSCDKHNSYTAPTSFCKEWYAKE